MVCSEQIVSPDDYFGTGFLTADSANPVADFNYLQFHRSHFERWERSAEFRRTLESFLASDAWEGPTVGFEPAPYWVVSR